MTDKPQYDSTIDTQSHIIRVRELMGEMQDKLSRRARVHDRSKLESPEKEVFDAETPNLASLTYGSPEYRASLDRMKVALNHHYAINSHHPEHYQDGIMGMSLLDLVEMLADWKAATERHKDGDIMNSIIINRSRFGYGEELEEVFSNTIREMGWE